MADDVRTCPECGRTCAGAVGLAAHRRWAHGVAGSSRATEAWRRQRAEKAERLAAEEAAAAAAAEAEAARAKDLAPALAAMLPGAADQLIDRLAQFVAQHEPTEHLWAVITHQDGPWLCHRTEVGRVGTHTRSAIVAVPITLVYEHLLRPRQVQEPTHA